MRLSYITKLLKIQGYCIARLNVETRRGFKAVIVELKRLRAPYTAASAVG